MGTLPKVPPYSLYNQSKGSALGVSGRPVS